MAAKHDIQRGIVADLAATDEQVSDACKRAAGPFGENARVHVADGRVTVALLTKPYLFRPTRRESPVVAVRHSSASAGRLRVETSVESYHTLQSKVLGFIPSGPKSLVGRGTFFKLLDALENELRALDPAAQITRR